MRRRAHIAQPLRRMTDGTLTLVVLVIVADLVIAVIITRVINRRGYTGLRKAL